VKPFLAYPALLAAAALCWAAPACATDRRIVEQFYDPAAIVTIYGHTGIETAVTFRADEHIDNIAVGDSTEWQVTPNKHASLVFIKPIHATSHSNMTVVTDKRTYLFDLVARPGVPAFYMLHFSYPPDPPPPPPPPSLLPAEADMLKADEAPPPQKTPADLHFGWVMSGTASLWPQRLFDDGEFVWMSWPKFVAPPAILRRDATAGDGPLNYRIEGDYIVIDGVPGQITLRRGKQSATLMAPARPGESGKATRHKDHSHEQKLSEPFVTPETNAKAEPTPPAPAGATP
jgi:type IV secretion system protein VirB9